MQRVIIFVLKKKSLSNEVKKITLEKIPEIDIKLKEWQDLRNDLNFFIGNRGRIMNEW